MTVRLVHLTTTDISLVLLLGDQLEAFAAAGYEVIGASASGPWVASLPPTVEHVAVRNATRSWAPRRDVAAAIELWRLFRRLRPDIVHTHNPKPGIYGRLAARAAGVPVVVNTVHGLYAVPEDPWWKRKAVYTAERLAAACSDAELVQAEEDLRTLASIGVPKGRLVHLGNGIDLKRFSPDGISGADVADVRRQMGAEPGDVVCGVVGRLVAEKGIGMVLEAAERLTGRTPRVRLVLIGPFDPDKRDALGVDLADAARRAGVVVLGLRDDMPACYAAMDIVLSASRREGIPRVPMEAAAMGLPVVATMIRGSREVVVDGVTGVLVPPGSAEAMAAAVAALAADPDRRVALGAAGRERARERFDQQRVIETTLDVYRRLVARRPSPGSVVTQLGTLSIRRADERDVDAAAALHGHEIPHGFLSSLGPRFLRRLYRRISRSPDAVLLVAVRDGAVVGMTAGCLSVGALYRSFAVRDGVATIARDGPRLLRSARSVVETLRHPAASGDLPGAELLSMAVSPGARGRGVGTALASGLVGELAAMGTDGVRVLVGADNDAAIAAYRRVGFALAGARTLHRGVSQQVLVWQR